MSTVDQAITAAARLGRLAAVMDRGLSSCPYPLDGTNVERAAAGAFVRAYLRLRPLAGVPVDEGDELLALAHGPDDTPTEG